MKKHVTIVGALHIAYAAWGIMWAVLIAVILIGIGSTLVGGDQTAQGILTTAGCIVPGFLFLISVPGIIGGIGVLRLKPWARYMVLVLSVLHLLSIPLGTALGIYSIVVLVHDETVELFTTGSG
ncbi:MAG TPA: hypothetical protein VM537_33700 [Anaerolineae bacterium]|nr:hypothetical protein [Anaerolineae bacterium]